MTYEEAIEQIERINNLYKFGTEEEAFNKAIEALEKQIPKKPLVDRIKVTSSAYDYQYSCPVCEVPISYGECCNNNKCRQCIDWSDDND